MMNLFDKFKFSCGFSAKNRVVLAPMTNGQSPTTELSGNEYAWLAMRIHGGYGIVTTCATHVLKSAQAWPGELGIFEDRHIAGFARLAKAAQEEDCLVIPQLFHGGFRCPSSVTGKQPVSASEFVIEMPNFEKPRALKPNEITEIEDAFTAAAHRALAAGLPGVEIHGANGYLFSQFLSQQTNRRADDWGGSLKNRARILLETVSKVRATIGRDHILGVRISPEDTNLLTLDIDEMLQVAQWLAELKVDYISLSLASARKLPIKYPDSSESILARFRKVIPKSVGITVSGQIWTRDDATAALKDGADFVALGASGIANPDWPVKAQSENFIPRRLPMTLNDIHKVGVSENFVNYLKPRKYVM